ncbi:hypothetical protein PN462_14465 [Spirulina sp. CS-785/01]|uniref:hypothetical protein n=1 Tax=Spirulina sp. CS-785/01 TaxID=3021716 RepID=UPI00232C3874|nr:hypothetical protein [Spirulina sp. CS-785/01]MDB9314314.1 hypothetical protein [Spirulina sp. CS-785/01]
MDATELIPILQRLSEGEKRSLLDFLKAELEPNKSASDSSVFIHPQQGQFGETLEAFRHQHKIAELEIDVDAIFGDIREKSSGREVIW